MKWKNKSNIVFLIIFINSIIESFLMIEMDRTIIVSFQFAINIILLLWLITLKRIVYPKLFKFAVFFIIYYFFLCIFSSAFATSLNYLLKFLIPLVYILIGYNVIRSKSDLILFIQKGWLILAYFTLHVLISNILDKGTTLYNNGLLVGYYSINGLYLPTFYIVINLFFLKFYPDRFAKRLNFVFSLLSSIIILIILKRTLILILLISIVFYVFSHFKIKSLVKLVFSFLLILLLIFFNKDMLLKNINSRESRFNEDYSITKEGRFTENEILYNELKKNALNLVFGSGEVFNDRATLTELRVYEEEREAHNSFIRIFWNGGIIGLLTFIYFYYLQFKFVYKELKSPGPLNPILKEILLFCILLIFLRFLTDFSSGITYLNYNAWSYFVISGILRICHEKYNQKLKFKVLN